MGGSGITRGGTTVYNQPENKSVTTSSNNTQQEADAVAIIKRLPNWMQICYT
jgi:hypothetical protein